MMLRILIATFVVTATICAKTSPDEFYEKEKVKYQARLDKAQKRRNQAEANYWEQSKSGKSNPFVNSIRDVKSKAKAEYDQEVLDATKDYIKALKKVEAYWSEKRNAKKAGDFRKQLGEFQRILDDEKKRQFVRRKEQSRKDLTAKYGGSLKGQASVNRALRWLASVQNANGSWGAPIQLPACAEPGHPGHTGLALLVFLAHGETEHSDKYGETVKRAMGWLGNYGNQKGLNVKLKPMAYAHPIATHAIADAYDLTEDAELKSAMENCVEQLIKGQMPNGGFGYAYAVGPRWDMSVSGWNMQALAAAKRAGCKNERLGSAIKKSIAFGRGIAYGGRGGFGYASKPGNQPNMGGIGTVSLQLLGAADTPQVREGCERIGNTRLKNYEQVMANPSLWGSIGSQNLYGWYYDSQAMFNTQKTDKERWKRWRKAMETVLIRAQHPEGYWETSASYTGSTTPGRILSTCWAAQQLEVYYRYPLPGSEKNRYPGSRRIDPFR